MQIRVSARHTAISEHDRGVISDKIDRLGEVPPRDGAGGGALLGGEEPSDRREGGVRGHPRGPRPPRAVQVARARRDDRRSTGPSASSRTSCTGSRRSSARKPRHKSNGAKWPTGEPPAPHRGPRAVEAEAETLTVVARRDGRRLPDREVEEGREAHPQPLRRRRAHGAGGPQLLLLHQRLHRAGPRWSTGATTATSDSSTKTG